MIVLGVSPGLKALAYSVIRAGSPPCAIDHDVLLGGRIKGSLADLPKKAHVHALVLDVVLERDPPQVIALGPPCNLKEAPEYVQAAIAMLKQMASRAGVPVIDMPEALLLKALCLPRESLPRAVNRLLGQETPLGTDDPRLVRAVGTALAALCVPPLSAAAPRRGSAPGGAA